MLWIKHDPKQRSQSRTKTGNLCATFIPLDQLLFLRPPVYHLTFKFADVFYTIRSYFIKDYHYTIERKSFFFL